MGMYDDIRIEIECPTCNTKIKGFQSKDGDCGMHLLEFWEVNNFYCSCPVCYTWIEYDIKQRPNRRLTIDDYYRSIKVPSKKELKKREKQMEELKELFAKNKNQESNHSPMKSEEVGVSDKQNLHCTTSDVPSSSGDDLTKNKEEVKKK